MTQFDILYQPRTAIKEQALADFIAEFTFPSEDNRDGQKEPPKWKLFVDGSSNENDSGARLILFSPENHRISSVLRFIFKASNNEAEYEALLAYLRLAKELQVDSLMIYSDSKLVVSQVLGEFQAPDDRMTAYLETVKVELRNFSRHEVKHIDREDNANADALAKLATSRDAELLRLVPIEVITEPSITKQHSIEAIDVQHSWMDDIVIYLKEDRLPEDRDLARKVRYHAEHYLLLNGRLYKRGISTPLLRCLSIEEAKKVLSEIHDGVCGYHSGGQSLAHKALLQGFYWPTMKQDAAEYARKCDECQRYSVLIQAHPE